MSYGEQKKAWAREWAQLRREFLDGKVLDAVALPSGRRAVGVSRVRRGRHRREPIPTRYDSRTQPHADPHQRRRPRGPGGPQGHPDARVTIDALPARPS